MMQVTKKYLELSNNKNFTKRKIDYLTKFN